MQSEAASSATNQNTNPACEGALAGAGKPGAAQRYGFVDLLRGFALVVMVETHVINAYLPVPSRNTSLFFWLSFVNGLVAPSFLFASGFSVLLQARRKWEDWIRLGPAFWKQVRRLGFILLAAYYLHLPHFGLSRYITAQDQSFWKRALQVDVLQCIVVSLLAIDAIILLTRKPAIFFWSALSIGVAGMLVTPLAWSQDFTGRMPLVLALYMNPHGVSLFPIFPWASFVLAGACASHLFLNSAARGADARYMRNTFAAGLALIAVPLFARSMPAFSFWNVGFYRTSPLYVMIRLGCVLILCATLYAMERRLGWMPRAIRLAGQESLLVYTLHLLLIFSILRGKAVSSLLGREAGYIPCLVISAAIVVLMIWIAGIWHGVKRDRPRSARQALAALIGINLIVFLVQ